MKGRAPLVAESLPVRLLVVIALLWGILLTGFFLYVPYLSSTSAETESGLISGLGWLTFSATAFGVGKAYPILSRQRAFRWGGGTVVAALLVPGIVFEDTLGYWAWLLLTIPLSLTLTVLLSHVVAQSQTASIARLSAMVGATPLVGLLVVSASFSLKGVRDFYPVLVGIGVLLGLGIALMTPRPVRDAPQGTGSFQAGWRELLGYGFLLGLGVALVNSHVFERIAEVTQSNADDVAWVGSLLILLSSVVGVAASLLAGTRLVRWIPRVTLAQFAALAVALGITILILAPTIALVAVAGLLVAIGFGVTNGVELRLVEAASDGTAARTTLFGLFLALTSIPYVVGSLLAMSLALLAPTTTPVLVVALSSVTLSIIVLHGKRRGLLRA